MDELLKLGKNLNYLKEMSDVEIGGKKRDLTFSGTYSEIRKKYRALSKVFHPDGYLENNITR